jgi:hypothetical protein
MTSSKRNMVRVSAKTMLLVLLPACGVSWTFTGLSHIAAIVTAICLAAAFVAETLAISTEDEIRELEVVMEQRRKQHANELAVLDEKLVKLDRVARILEGQNHDMRAELITTLVRIRDSRNDTQTI